jgi:hypothetical protein
MSWGEDVPARRAGRRWGQTMDPCPVIGCQEKARVVVRKRKLCKKHAPIFKADPSAIDFKEDG